MSANYPGTDIQEKIRNYVKIVHRDSGLTYLLLGGDVNVVPVRNAYAMDCEMSTEESRDNIFPCDLYYSDLDGTWNANGNTIYGEVADGVDLYPDIFVGRASVDNLYKARAFVDKILTYEKYPPTDYQLKALFDADILWTYPYTDEGIAKNMIDDESIPGRYFITKNYQSLGLGGSSFDSVNSGQNLINHNGHGWYTIGLFDIPQMDAFTNNPRNGILYSIGCWTNAFDYDAVSEHFVNNPNGGGVAYIGNTSYGWGSPGNPGYGYSDLFDAAFFRELFNNNFYRIGITLAQAKASYIAQSREENVYRWHQYDVNLIGDPEMPIWTDTPKTLTVLCPQIIPLGPGQVRVSISNGTLPIENALVCLQKGTEVYLREFSSAGGEALFDVAPASAGKLTITVTAQNHLPYQADILVGDSLAYLDIIRYTIDDSTGGNGDGLINPGETVYLPVMLKNFGNLGASMVSAKMQCGDSLVSILDSQQVYGNIPAGDSSSGPGEYSFTVSKNATNKHALVFDFQISDSFNNTWPTSISMLVATPVLSYYNHEITDTAGNNNGVAEPGETIGLNLNIKNKGLGIAKEVACGLSTADTSLILIDTIKILGNVSPDSVAASNFKIYISPGSSNPHVGVINLRLRSGAGYSFDDSLAFVVGQTGLIDSMETETGGWSHGGTNDLWHITSHRKYLGVNSWYCGQETTWQYINNMQSLLVSPPFILGPNSKLSFWRAYGLALYGTDGLFTEIFYNGRWDTLGFIGSGGALNSLLGISGNWTEEIYDLSQYGYGDTARIRFTFISDGSETYEGFYIDGFRVASTKSTWFGATVDLLDPNGGETWSGSNQIRWRLGESETDSRKILLDYTRNEGSSWDTIKSLTAQSPEWATSSYSWNTSTSPNDCNYKLRIRLSEGPDTVSDISLGTFTVYNLHDTISSREHVSGGSNTVFLNPYIVDQSLLNGHRYELRFREILKDTTAANDYTPIYGFDFWDATTSVLLIPNIIFYCPQTANPLSWVPDPIDGVVAEIKIAVDRNTFSPYSFKIKNDVNILRPPSTDTLRANANIDQYWPWRGSEYEIRWQVKEGPHDTLDTLWAEVWDITNGVKVPLDTSNSWSSMKKSAWAISPTASSKGVGYVSYHWPTDVYSYIYICGSRFYFNRGAVTPRIITWSTKPEEGEIWVASTLGQRPPHDGDVYSYTASAETTGPIQEIPLFQNRPNPFNEETVISYQLPQETIVKIKIYNINGQLVKILVDQPQKSGYYTVAWQGTNESGNAVSNGLYFYRLETTTFSNTKKMLLLK